MTKRHHHHYKIRTHCTLTVRKVDILDPSDPWLTSWLLLFVQVRRHMFGLPDFQQSVITW